MRLMKAGCETKKIPGHVVPWEKFPSWKRSQKQCPLAGVRAGASVASQLESVFSGNTSEAGKVNFVRFRALESHATKRKPPTLAALRVFRRVLRESFSRA